MEMKSLVEYFYETADRWYRYVTADMCYVGQQISDNSKRKIRNNFNIPVDEEILYFSDHTLFTYWKSGIVITDKSFYVQNSSTPFYKFNWCDFEEVEYKEDCFIARMIDSIIVYFAFVVIDGTGKIRTIKLIVMIFLGR